MAPIGASAVLLFAVRASPLAQPWAILGGKVISALISVFAAIRRCSLPSLCSTTEQPASPIRIARMRLSIPTRP